MLSKAVLTAFISLFLFAFNSVEDGNLLYYKGTIGNNDKIQMNFELNNSGNLKGSYIVELSGELFMLEGKVDTEIQYMNIEVYNSDKVLVANIAARYFIDAQDNMQAIRGVYTTVDTNQRKTIRLEKVAEIIA